MHDTHDPGQFAYTPFDTTSIMSFVSGSVPKSPAPFGVMVLLLNVSDV